MIDWLESGNHMQLSELSLRAYRTEHSNYPLGLNARNSQLYASFIQGDSRRVLGWFDSGGQLRIAVGVAEFQFMPSWLLSWVLSDIKSAEFVPCWHELMEKLCNYFLSRQRREFYMVSPVDRSHAWLRLMKPLLTKYHSSVERVVPANTHADFALYRSIMGNATFPYSVKINRYQYTNAWST